MAFSFPVGVLRAHNRPCPSLAEARICAHHTSGELRRGLRSSHAFNQLRLQHQLGFGVLDIPEGLAMVREWTGLSEAEVQLLARQHGRLSSADTATVGKLLCSLLLLYNTFAAVGSALLDHHHYSLVRPDSIEEAGQYLRRLGVPAMALGTVFECQPQVSIGPGSCCF